MILIIMTELTMNVDNSGHSGLNRLGLSCPGTESSWTELSGTEKSWTELTGTEKSWTEVSGTEMSWTEMFGTETSWTEMSRTDMCRDCIDSD